MPTGAALAGCVLGTKFSGEGAARLCQSPWGTLPQPFTMRPASTVGTSVSLLPSPTPNSCSFPELSRLGRGRKRVRPRRQGSDPEGRAVFLGEIWEPYPPLSLPGLQTREVVCVWGGAGSVKHLAPRAPMQVAQTSFPEAPTLHWGTTSAPQQSTFSSPGRQCTLAVLCHPSLTPGPAPASNSPTPARRSSLWEPQGLAFRVFCGARLPLLPPSLAQAAAAQTKETLPQPPLPHGGPSAGDGHCVSLEARGGSAPRPGGDLNTRGEGETAGVLGG